MPTAAAANQATNASKPRTSLNKRVAFPMQSSAVCQTPVKTTAEGLPLPFSTAKYQPPAVSLASSPPAPAQMSSSPPLPPPSILSADLPSSAPLLESKNPTQSDSFDSAAAQEQCHSIFDDFVDKMAQTNVEPGKLNEIRKRLESLYHMWQENKLDDSVQRNLYELAKGLIFFLHEKSEIFQF